MNVAADIEGHEAGGPALVSRGRTTTHGTLRDQVACMRGALVARGDAHDITSRQVDGELRPAIDGLVWAGGIGTLLPVAVPPIGRTPPGLPVGVQVVAPHLHDRTAVAVAGHLEGLLGGFVPPPAYAGARTG